MVNTDGKFVDQGKNNAYTTSVAMALGYAKDYTVLRRLEHTVTAQQTQAPAVAKK